MLTRKPSAGACVRLSLSAALFVGAGACAKTPPPSLPTTGTVTVGVTSRGPGVETMAFGVSIEPGGINGVGQGRRRHLHGPQRSTGQSRCPHEGASARVPGRGRGGADGARLARSLDSRAVRDHVHVTRTRPRWPWGFLCRRFGTGRRVAFAALSARAVETGSRPGAMTSVDTMPSFAPRTAARSHPIRSLR